VEYVQNSGSREEVNTARARVDIGEEVVEVSNQNAEYLEDDGSLIDGSTRKDATVSLPNAVHRYRR